MFRILARAGPRGHRFRHGNRVPYPYRQEELQVLGEPERPVTGEFRANHRGNERCPKHAVGDRFLENSLAGVCLIDVQFIVITRQLDKMFDVLLRNSMGKLCPVANFDGSIFAHLPFALLNTAE